MKAIVNNCPVQEILHFSHNVSNDSAADVTGRQTDKPREKQNLIEQEEIRTQTARCVAWKLVPFTVYMY